MNKESLKYSKYFWDLNKRALKEAEYILKNPENKKFRAMMIKLLSRCQNPEELFSVISKKNFIRAWPLLRRYWIRIEKESDFRSWWQTIYEQILKRKIKKQEIEGVAPALFKSIGSRIKQARIGKEMSQRDLALAVGMKQPDISKIEEGRKNITLETLARICNCLGIREISLIQDI